MRCLWLESRKKSKESCEGKLAESSVHVVLFLFQNFDAWLAVKLMDICYILCVQSAFQKLCRMVAQNLSFDKDSNLENV